MDIKIFIYQEKNDEQSNRKRVKRIRIDENIKDKKDKEIDI